MSCVFCEIAKNNPTPKDANVVYADENVLAFLDIQPLVDSKLHLLVIPRTHYATLDTVSATDAGYMGAALSKVAKAAIEATNSSGYNIIQNNGAIAGQIVDHVHFHIVIRDPKSPQSRTVADIVKVLKQQVGQKSSLVFNAQVYGKGLREDLEESELEAKLRSLLRGKL